MDLSQQRDVDVIIGPRKTHLKPMFKYASIFQAEVYAIDRDDRGQTIGIMIDIQAAIKARCSNLVKFNLVCKFI